MSFGDSDLGTMTASGPRFFQYDSDSHYPNTISAHRSPPTAHQSPVELFHKPNFTDLFPNSFPIQRFVLQISEMIWHWGNIRSRFFIHQLCDARFETYASKVVFHRGNDGSRIQQQTLPYFLWKQCCYPNSFTIHHTQPKAIVDTGWSMKIHRVSATNDRSPHQSCVGRPSTVRDRECCISAVFVFVAACSVRLPTCRIRQCVACGLEQL